MSNLVTLEHSSKKLKFDISRSYVTLTFDPRSFKLFEIKDFVTYYVCAKFDKIWTIQSKVLKSFRFEAKTLFLKLQYLKKPLHLTRVGNSLIFYSVHLKIVNRSKGNPSWSNSNVTGQLIVC